MPELPEVETVKRVLEKVLINEEITDCIIHYPRIVQNVSITDFRTSLQGEVFQEIKRRGKFLIFILSNTILVSHLRMEGKYFIKDAAETVDKHEHIIFKLRSGLTLRYHDTRKFGTMHLFKTKDLNDVLKIKPLSNLGVEPLTDELTYAYLAPLLQKTARNIKAVLLDQSIISGLGNIYVNEVLFLSAIHPEKQANKLSKNKIYAIIDNTKAVLTKAIGLGGTSIHSFKSSLEVSGRFQNELQIHMQDTCPKCQRKVTKIFVAQRGTYMCRLCQLKTTPDNKIIIGITGGIATGKSLITSELKQRGFYIIDSDIVAKEIMTSSESVINFMQENFLGIYNEDTGQYNYKELGQIIFSNAELRTKLNEIVHPLVKEEIKNLITESNEEIIIVDVPLLYEAGFEDLFSLIIVVYLDYKTQINRLMKRDDISRKYAELKIAAQMDIAEKVKQADFVIDNTGSITNSLSQLDDILFKIKERISYGI